MTEYLNPRFVEGRTYREGELTEIYTQVGDVFAVRQGDTVTIYQSRSGFREGRRAWEAQMAVSQFEDLARPLIDVPVTAVPPGIRRPMTRAERRTLEAQEVKDGDGDAAKTHEDVGTEAGRPDDGDRQPEPANEPEVLQLMFRGKMISSTDDLAAVPWKDLRGLAAANGVPPGTRVEIEAALIEKFALPDAKAKPEGAS